MKTIKTALVLLVAFGIAAGGSGCSRPSEEEKTTEADVPSDMEALINQLHSEVPAERASAARELGEMGENAAAAVPFLVEMLGDYANFSESATVEGAAAEALTKIGEPAVQPLIAALKHEDAGICHNAAKVLSKIGEPAVQPLIDVLEDENENARADAAYALGIIRDSRAVEPLISVLNDGHADVRKSAAHALGRAQDKRAVEPLTALLQDEEWYVRSTAADALGKIEDSRALDALVNALEDEDFGVRRSAAHALELIGDKRAIEPLTAALEDFNAEVQAAAARALKAIREKESTPVPVPAEVQELIDKLNSENPEERAGAAYELGQMGEKAAPAVPFLIEMLEGNARFDFAGAGRITTPGVEAACALVKIGKPAVEPLIEALRHEDRRIRISAAAVLAETGDARAAGPFTNG